MRQINHQISALFPTGMAIIVEGFLRSWSSSHENTDTTENGRQTFLEYQLELLAIGLYYILDVLIPFTSASFWITFHPRTSPDVSNNNRSHPPTPPSGQHPGSCKNREWGTCSVVSYHDYIRIRSGKYIHILWFFHHFALLLFTFPLSAPISHFLSLSFPRT